MNVLSYETERWKEISGYPNYLISDYGRIHSRTSNLLMRSTPNRYGIHKIRLYNDDGYQDFYVHRLVMRAFGHKMFEGDQVKHKNDNRSQNHISNLYVVNRKKSLIPRYQPVSLRGRPIFVVETGEIFSNARECAYKLNGSYSAIYACLRGERKQHLGFTYKYLY